jgi:hypothetical protein
MSISGLLLLDEVTAFVAALHELSRQLGGTFVGSITNGKPDHSRSDDLLAEWKR